MVMIRILILMTASVALTCAGNSSQVSSECHCQEDDGTPKALTGQSSHKALVPIAPPSPRDDGPPTLYVSDAPAFADQALPPSQSLLSAAWPVEASTNRIYVYAASGLSPPLSAAV